MNHQGKSLHRLNNNPLEKAYHDAWIEANKGGICHEAGILQYMLGDYNNPALDLTERDAMVAATVIQWLGSPVGQNFLNVVLERSLGKELE